VIEQDAGGAGKALTDRCIRDLLRGYNSRADRVTGTKFVRAQPVAAAASNNLIRVVRNQHTQAFLDELSSFPHGRHDDCVDALAGAHHQISRQPRPGAMRSSVPTGRIPTSSEIIAHNARRLDYRDDAIYGIAAVIGAQVYDTTHLRRCGDQGRRSAYSTLPGFVVYFDNDVTGCVAPAHLKSVRAFYAVFALRVTSTIA
jgi:hypothetical protein